MCQLLVQVDPAIVRSRPALSLRAESRRCLSLRRQKQDWDSFTLWLQTGRGWQRTLCQLRDGADALAPAPFLCFAS